VKYHSLRSAITSLSRIHEDLNRTRAVMGLTAGEVPRGVGKVRRDRFIDERSALQQWLMSHLFNGTQPETELTREVLELAEFGLQALEHYNKQEALASVGMQY